MRLFTNRVEFQRENEDIEVFNPGNTLNEKVCAQLKRSSFCIHRGRLLSIGKFIFQKKTKEMLGVRFNAIAVEMESSGVAQAAKESGVPFIAIKVISDDLRGGLVNYNKLVDYNGNLVVRKIIPYFLAKPREIIWAIRFYRDLNRVYDKLFEVQDKIIEVI